MFNIVINSNDDELKELGRIGDVSVDLKGLRSLVGTNWIRTNIIDGYMVLLEKEEVQNKFLLLYFMSFIKCKDYKSIKSFKKIFLNENYDFIYCPFLCINHYVLIVVNKKDKVLNNIFY